LATSDIHGSFSGKGLRLGSSAINAARNPADVCGDNKHIVRRTAGTLRVFMKGELQIDCFGVHSSSSPWPPVPSSVNLVN
jgi:hypothetical protein